ncbi:PucR family transcriptional regulator [Nocardioides sp. JQ2195]|uniref:PucR family transcriptional regulator n=1 Tax=Nocardioides sp. JQ2195 TaxID=2592334 RepID=UPI00143E74AD|nr:helix-turn-helix domain-containing protein [Nocardioides sp. JQ2195]QIX28345.1 PucR family transcriptional regulator [Nocardioides sp. JQ2195]
MSEPRGIRLDALTLPGPVIAAMRRELPGCAERVVTSVIREVPSYSEPFRGRMGRNIESAVAMALGGFLDMTAAAESDSPSGRVQAVFEAAYSLGRGEARSGRSMDALAAAYRVGARTAWHDLSSSAVEAGLPAAELARFAELVFDYIDELSAVSVSGHADELATSGRVRERHLERLAAAILRGLGTEHLLELADRASWTPPTTLTAVIAPESVLGSLRQIVDATSISAGSDVAGLEGHDAMAVLLVADLDRGGRGQVAQRLRDRSASIGPTRPWDAARSSYERALRALDLALVDGDASVDTDDHLVPLVLSADTTAREELRARVMAPMEGLRPSTVEKLTETLLAWLLHQGRRDDIAAALFVHPQTVRYRVGRLRELYGDRLADPEFVREATVALA